MSIDVNHHVCSACKNQYSSDHWTADTVKKHRHRGSDLVCKSCEGKGCSARDVNFYHCNGCQQDFGHGKFNRYSLYDEVKTDRRPANLFCEACEAMIPCDGCKKRYPEAAWPKKRPEQQNKSRLQDRMPAV